MFRVLHILRIVLVLLAAAGAVVAPTDTHGAEHRHGAHYHDQPVVIKAATASDAGLSVAEKQQPTPLACDASPGLQDQIWMVSTRQLGFPRMNCDPALRISRCDGCQRFHQSDLQTLLESDDPRYTTVIYVHGNRIKCPDATRTGFEAYRMLCSGRPCNKPLRLIVWSWPSQRVVLRALRDIVIKLERTVAEEYYLAWFLARMNPHRPVSLIGYSFGGRICCGALQLRAGGCLGGYRLENRPALTAPTRLTLIAAACDSRSLAAHGEYPLAMPSVDKALVLWNRLDPALLLYPLIDRRRPSAIGRVGPVRSGPGARRISAFNCSGSIGRCHSVHEYLSTRCITRLINRNAFWED